MNIPTEGPRSERVYERILSKGSRDSPKKGPTKERKKKGVLQKTATLFPLFFLPWFFLVCFSSSTLSLSSSFLRIFLNWFLRFGECFLAFCFAGCSPRVEALALSSSAKSHARAEVFWEGGKKMSESPTNGRAPMERKKSFSKKMFGTLRSKSKIDGETSPEEEDGPPQRSKSGRILDQGVLADRDDLELFAQEKSGVVFGRNLEELLAATYGGDKFRLIQRAYTLSRTGRSESLSAVTESEFDAAKSETRVPIPLIVLVLTDWLSLEDRIKEEGLFRITGSSSEVKLVRKWFERHLSDATLKGFSRFAENPGNGLDSPISVSAVASVLKTFFRELPEPVVISRFYTTLLRIMDNPEASENQKLQRVRMLVKGMPQASSDTLMYMLRFLDGIHVHSDVNLMTVDNLATVWAPTLIREVEEDTVTMGRSRTASATAADLAAMFDVDKVTSAVKMVRFE
jgi:RhoGAP domain